MSPVRRLPIHMRLAAIGVITGAVVALVVCAALVGYVALTFRATLVRNLAVQADTLAYNATTALLFDDRDSARRTLQALSADEHVLGAAIYTPSGEMFASYERLEGSQPPPPPAGVLAASRVEADRIVVSRPVLLEGRPAGVVTVASDLGALRRLIRQMIATAAAVFAGTLLLAYGISRRLERGISGPIVDLTRVARRVSEDKDYTVRASEHGSDEIAILCRAFNDMLEQIRLRETELRQANERLEQRVQARTAQLEASNRELEAFSYSVSHDLRAPLRGVMGFAELARTEGAAAPPELRRYLDKIVDAGRRMGQLIDHLLIFSRMGRTSMESTDVDLAALVDEVRRELASDAGGRVIDWEIGRLPVVHGDRAMLRLALFNLLANAVKYTGPRPRARIAIAAREEDGMIELSVRDNGVGFDMAYVSKLFGVFQRLHRADEFEGTGIGLANVQRIVERHGGKAWAEGALDQGATFHITLPRGRGARA